MSLVKFYKNQIKYPILIVFYEKHEDRYFMVTSEKDLMSVMLKICTERVAEGWYRIEDVPDTFEEYIEKETGLSLKEIEGLPEKAFFSHRNTGPGGWKKQLCHPGYMFDLKSFCPRQSGPTSFAQ